MAPIKWVPYPQKECEYCRMTLYYICSREPNKISIPINKEWKTTFQYINYDEINNVDFQKSNLISQKALQWNKYMIDPKDA